MSTLPKTVSQLERGDSRVDQQLEAQRMETIGRMVSGVAHDFNNLLTGIVLCSDLLLGGLEENSRLRRYVQEIRTAATQGAGTIQQLMEVARQRSVAPSPLSFNEAITGMRSLLRRFLGEDIELHTELADNLKLVKMDPARVQQLILNLVLNARDAMSNGGQITLTTRNSAGAFRTADGNQPGGFVEFEVRDTGCGMDLETRSRVFEPFFTTKQPGRGSGLGLTVVADVLKQGSGTIEIESEPGKGTRVVIRLPAVELEAQHHQRATIRALSAASASVPGPAAQHQERERES